MTGETSKIPLSLTLGGILPFAGLAAGMVLFREDIAMRQTLALWLVLYAAVIASFVAGIRWGAAMAAKPRPDGGVLAVSVLPPLLAWAAAGAFFRFADALVLLGLAALFAGLYVWDRRSADLPAWYRDLRRWPSLGAVASLLLAYILLR